jgi:hypothetical protein
LFFGGSSQVGCDCFCYRLTAPKKTFIKARCEEVILKNQEGQRLGSSDAPSTSVRTSVDKGSTALSIYFLAAIANGVGVVVVVVVGYGVFDNVVLVRKWPCNVSSRVVTRGSKF